MNEKITNDNMPSKEITNEKIVGGNRKCPICNKNGVKIFIGGVY